uniref:BZIP domain-containing protein n=1 Tax=Panagrellus redivivus TaxID=6233 RepID=A0A7E4W4B6_PANRE
MPPKRLVPQMNQEVNQINARAARQRRRRQRRNLRVRMEKHAKDQLIHQLQRYSAVQKERLHHLNALRAKVIRALGMIQREALELLRYA